MGVWDRLPLGWRMTIGAGVPFGLGMAGWFALLGGDPALVGGLGLATGLAFGLSMAISMGLLQVLWVSRGGKQTATLSTRAGADLSVCASAEQVAATLRAILAAQGAQELDADAQGSFTFRTSADLRSWGEIVSFTIVPRGAQTWVRLRSRPALRTTLVDYGKNQENVERLVQHLRAELGEAPWTEDDQAALAKIAALAHASRRSAPQARDTTT